MKLPKKFPVKIPQWQLESVGPVRWVEVGLAAILILWLVGSFISLQLASGQIKKTWQEVVNLEQQRFDLLPPLKTTLQLELGVDESVFTSISEAQQRWQNSDSLFEKMAAVNL